MNRKSFFDEATFNQKIIFFAMGLLMAVFSIYLTSHYFTVKYPTGFEEGSMCNISSFFNCDSTTLSPFGNIAGIPISIFGILVGAFLMVTYLFKSDEAEGTLYTVLGLNVVGCIVLFLYSIIGLGHLCPFCTLYYVCSIVAFIILHKLSENRSPSVKHMAIYGVVTLAVAGSSWGMIQSWEGKHVQRAQQLVKMFNELQNLGAPAKSSPYRLASSTEKFTDAPIQFSVFSDFQCPACNAFNKVLPKIEEKYKGKINVQYFFYPLDHNCNAAMDRPLHPLACKAAYLASCAGPVKFKKVHDDIFEAQSELSVTWIDDYAKKLGVTECMEKPEIKQAVVDMINQADGFGVKSTPTQLLNGVKIEGVRQLRDYYAIMDDILKKAGK
jgi:protein-disulfide isomerase/uncharacterized membrane protein